MRPRAVFDCMMFLQAVVSPGGPALAAFERCEAGVCELLVSHDVLREVEDVLTRPELSRKFRRLTPGRASAFLSRVRGMAVLIEDVPLVFRYPRDPKDEPYINLALAAGAQFIVTRDNDLLDLAGQGEEATRLRQLCPSLLILDPVAFLRALRPPRDPAA